MLYRQPGEAIKAAAAPYRKFSPEFMMPGADRRELAAWLPRSQL